jgi:hypothetical protein
MEQAAVTLFSEITTALVEQPHPSMTGSVRGQLCERLMPSFDTVPYLGYTNEILRVRLLVATTIALTGDGPAS